MNKYGRMQGEEDVGFEQDDLNTELLKRLMEKEETNKYHLDKSQDPLKVVREEDMEETAPYPRLNLQQMEDLNKVMDMIGRENMMPEESKMAPVNKFKNSNLSDLMRKKQPR